MVADYLSRLELEESQNTKEVQINEDFSDEHLFLLDSTVPWFADYVTFLATNITPPDLTRQQITSTCTETSFTIKAPSLSSKTQNLIKSTNSHQNMLESTKITTNQFQNTSTNNNSNYSP